MQRSLAAAIVFIGLVASSSAFAQDVPEIQLETFRPATGPTDYLALHSSLAAPHLEFDFGAYLDFADDPLKGRSVDSDAAPIIDEQTTLSLHANLGLFDFMEVGILIPVTVLQTSGDLTPILGANSLPGQKVEKWSINDPRISLKFTALDLMRQQFGLGFVLRGSIPLGLDDRFSGDENFSIDALVVPEMWIVNGIRVSGNFGYRYRHEAVTVRDSVVGAAILWGLATSVPLFMDRLDLVAEIDGKIGVAENPPGRPSGIAEGETPTEFRAALRYKLVEDWTITGGLGLPLNQEGIGTPDFRGILSINGRWVSGGKWGFDYDGDGIFGIYDKCPYDAEDYDGFQDEDGCPDYDNDGDGVTDEFDKCDNTPTGVEVGADGCPDNDLDGDGIPNNLDKCPEDPEDLDGFEDSDGCPDFDNDKDGIPDTADACPNEPETFNDFLDDDGCPDDPNAKVHLTRDRIIITEQVYFKTGKAIIQTKSYAILDAVVAVMKENPQIEKIRVEGHTDDRGAEEMNLKLSDDRSKSVRQYLIDNGVSATRIEAEGFGESTPIKDNNTKSGRALNRRVEFTIMKMKSFK